MKGIKEQDDSIQFFFAFDKLHGLLKTLNLWYFGVDIKKTIYDKIRLVVRSYPKKVPFFFFLSTLHPVSIIRRFSQRGCRFYDKLRARVYLL